MSEPEAPEHVPAEFEQLPSGLGFTDSLQPSYRRIAGDKAHFGLVVQAQHCNTMGICHGGVLMTLADITAATGVNLARGVRAGSPTVHLSMEFISSARHGQWVQADVEQVSIKRRFGFCSGGIYNSAGVVARFSGTFYFPDHSGMWKDGRRGDGVLQDQNDKD
ncbi:MAG: PaaI family thioesterase [Halioglobus sp.]|nr:PaaI family thioesterase [Halioglobus sp.]